MGTKHNRSINYNPKRAKECRLALKGNTKNKNLYGITLRIPVKNDDQWQHIQNAEDELAKAGVWFDTSYDLQCGIREWQMDWSLSGADLKYSTVIRMKNDLRSGKMIKMTYDDIQFVTNDGQFTTPPHLQWNFNPKMKEFLAFLKKYPKAEAEMFAYAWGENDPRLYLNSIEYVGKVTKVMKEDSRKLCANAEEKSITNHKIYCFFD